MKMLCQKKAEFDSNLSFLVSWASHFWDEHLFFWRSLHCYVVFFSVTGKMFPTQGDLHVTPFTDEALYLEQFSKANFWCETSLSYYRVSLLQDTSWTMSAEQTKLQRLNRERYSSSTHQTMKFDFSPSEAMPQGEGGGLLRGGDMRRNVQLCRSVCLNFPADPHKQVVLSSPKMFTSRKSIRATFAGINSHSTESTWLGSDKPQSRNTSNNPLWCVILVGEKRQQDLRSWPERPSHSFVGYLEEGAWPKSCWGSNHVSRKA